MGKDSGPWRIVVADSDPAGLAEAKSALQRGSRRRYTFLEAGTMADAVRLCHGDPRPDCAVVDFQLPDGTALDVLRALSTDGPRELPPLPVVILTCGTQPEESRAVLRAGAQDFVGKDWLTPDSLTRAVEQAVERHAMARELGEREASWQAMYEQAAAGIVTCAPDGRFLTANPAFCAMLGYTWEELRQQSVFDLTHPDDREADLAQVRRVIAGELHSYSLEKRYLHKEGRTVWGHLGSAPIRNARGELTSGVGVVVDITERKAADDELRRREREFRRLTDNTPDILTRFDREFRHLFVNAAVERVTGKPRAHFLGKSNRELGMPESLCDLWETALARVFTTGMPETIEFDFDSPEGTHSFSGWLVPEPDLDGSIGSVLGVTRDITERRRIEREREQLLVAERAARSEVERVAEIKDEFLATLSHELRTPLSAILGWTALLQQNADADLMREGIEVIARNAQAQAQLIADLLDMSRIVSGKLRIEVGPVDLDQVARAALDTISPAAEAKGVRLTPRLATGLPPMRGDASRLQQVLWNLLSNAVKFTPAGGEVTLRSAVVDGRIELAVEDTGEGVDPAFVPFLFDRFSQADASAARQHGGLGLGLSIVKQLCELHGGTVRAESPGLGRGTRFTVSLPLTAALVPQAFADPTQDRSHRGLEPAESESEPVETDLTGISVLLVDDQNDALEVVRRMLSESGAVVATATTARAALEHLRRQVPSVLLCDIGMPEMDGYQLIREIREGLRLRPLDLPAAALTAFARREDRDRALAAGFQAHLGKPCLPRQLLATIASLAQTGAAPRA